VVLIFAKLIKTRRRVLSVLVAIIISTFFSSVYGVVQSLGYDAINWSLDPTLRVFACINNPVHFCAYMGMAITLSMALTFYVIDGIAFDPTRPYRRKLMLGGIFVMTAFIYYAQFLSYSRATWLGFLAAMTLFFMHVIEVFNKDSKYRFLTDFFITSALISVVYLYHLFHIQDFGQSISVVIHLVLFILLGALFFVIPRSLMTSNTESISRKQLVQDFGWTTSFFILIYLQIIYPMSQDTLFPIWIHVGLATGLIFSSLKVTGDLRHLFAKLMTIIVFAQLQFIGASITHFLIFLSIIASFYCLAFMHRPTHVSFEKKWWLMAYLILFSVGLLIPNITGFVVGIAHNEDRNIKIAQSPTALKVLVNANEKINSYRNVAIKGSARTSMWKSSFPWIKDYWLVGSGLDTIKYMYPVYRRPDYGILEGGHNFTPDRLHNEYLNTLATKGILGFIAYYGFFILGWLILVIKGLYDRISHPSSFLILGCIAGVYVYLGQVLFNFGVVATLFLFYALIGMGLALIHYVVPKDDEGAISD
ncbi:O-antigen ligase family protein, partial [bacterium]|nr:O-antigen ligase family protein [bacterium]